MKFSALTLLAATCVAPVAGEFYFKENFNDDVSDEEDNTMTWLYTVFLRRDSIFCGGVRRRRSL
jgi:hypothetical protein